MKLLLTTLTALSFAVGGAIYAHEEGIHSKPTCASCCHQGKDGHCCAKCKDAKKCAPCCDKK